MYVQVTLETVAKNHLTARRSHYLIWDLKDDLEFKRELLSREEDNG